MRCTYCTAPATTKIPAEPPYVCTLHAREFWTGLLAFNRLEREESAVAQRAFAIAYSGPSPRDHADGTVVLRLVS